MKVASIRLCRIIRYLPSGMRLHAFVVIAILGAACRSAPTPVTVSVPAPAPAAGVARGALPPVPLVEGPLAPRVVYPQLNQMIQSRDSTFILGSVGNGRATLTINGQPVKVWPNGAYLGFVANPPPTAPEYQLVAVV